MVRSEGRVREEQADVLGLYRLVDSHQERPLYKQDGGENWLFFSPGGAGGAGGDCWVVGTSVGSQYGWLRNSLGEQGQARWPAGLGGAWQYRDSFSGTWRGDDTTLRVLALPGKGYSVKLVVLMVYLY